MYSVAEQKVVGLSKTRIYLVAFILLFLLLILVVKAGRLQLLLGDELKDLAQRQYQRELSFQSPRGRILDRHLKPLAISVPVTSVAANPKEIFAAANKAEILSKLGPFLSLSRANLEKRLSGHKSFVWLQRRLNKDVAEKLRALKLKGITFHQENKRFAPNRSLAGQVLGTVSIDGHGQSGIEYAYDKYLQGRKQRFKGLRNNRGQMASFENQMDKDFLEGAELILSLDTNLQHVAERALSNVVKELSAKSASAVVMDPFTGEILAISSAPLFNPNAPSTSEKGASRHHALSDIFEPGSTFKTVTFAAALEAGVINKNTEIFCENGKMKVGRFHVRDHQKEGMLSAEDVYKVSSNIGTVKIQQMLGADKLQEMVLKLGFGQKSSLKLREVAKGRVPKGNWGETRAATISFGHGLSVTALQLASMISTIAADGIRVQPKLVLKIQNSNGEVINFKQDVKSERVLKKSTTDVLKQMMSRVFEKGGTGVLAKLDGVKAGGKTGTAEKVDPITKRYSHHLNLASFVGFAPLDKPKYVVVVVVDEPHGRVFGGSAAGPVWKEIMENALFKEIQYGENTAQDKNRYKTNNLAKKKTLTVDKNSLKRIKKNTKRKEQFIGLRARSVLALAQKLKVDIEIKGSGEVISQREYVKEDGRTVLELLFK